jgi:serine/threonine-protein kinase
MQSPGGLQTTVAVKLLRADIDLNGSAVQRLRDEGRLLARLDHPAILKVFDLVTLDGRLALVTELVDGDDLSSCLAELPQRALVQAIGQVAGALAAAKETPGPDGPLQLVHRDVKPSNIRLDRHGRAKLLDFGIARFDASDREVRTASDLVIGSIPYMAPERFIHRTVVPSSDIFSLGCTLYEGLTGHKFYGTRKVAVISGLALRPETYGPFLQTRLEGLDCHPMVLGLLVDLLTLEPDDRPTAAAVADRAEEAADALSGASLRSWAQHHTWPSTLDRSGLLCGQTLVEHPLEEATGPTTPELPVIHHRPVLTLEAASLPSARPPDEVSTIEDGLVPTERVASVEPVATETLSELVPVDMPREGRGSTLGIAVLAVAGLIAIALASLGVGLLTFVVVWGALAS